MDAASSPRTKDQFNNYQLQSAGLNEKAFESKMKLSRFSVLVFCSYENLYHLFLKKENLGKHLIITQLQMCMWQSKFSSLEAI
jgi:hypothetical protein